MGIAEDTGRGILDKEGQDALLPPAPLGDVMLLDQGILAMEGDGVEIQVEGSSARQAEPADGVEPAAHQLGVAGRGDPATVSVRNERLGMTFNPAKRASPWSSTELMTWP